MNYDLDHSAWMVFGKHEGLEYDPEPIILVTTIDLAEKFIKREHARRAKNATYGYATYFVEEWGVFSSLGD